eukprot:UN03420
MKQRMHVKLHLILINLIQLIQNNHQLVINQFLVVVYILITTAQDALPAGVNMLSNALLRYHFKQQFQRQYGYSIDEINNNKNINTNNGLTATLPSIELINNPLPRTKNRKLICIIYNSIIYW